MPALIGKGQKLADPSSAVGNILFWHWHQAAGKEEVLKFWQNPVRGHTYQFKNII